MARLQSTLTIAIAIVLAFSSTVRTQSIIIEETQIITVDPQQSEDLPPGIVVKCSF